MMISIISHLNGFPGVNFLIALTHAYEFSVGITGTGARINEDKYK
jgi:hypothetical protein